MRHDPPLSLALLLTLGLLLPAGCSDDGGSGPLPDIFAHDDTTTADAGSDSVIADAPSGDSGVDGSARDGSGNDVDTTDGGAADAPADGATADDAAIDAALDATADAQPADGAADVFPGDFFPPVPDALPDGLNLPDGPIVGCGAVSAEGCCKGAVLFYCDQVGVLNLISCAVAPKCGWDAVLGVYDCDTAGGADPSGAKPKACPF